MYIYASEASVVTTSHIMDFKKQKEKSISSSSKLINHLCSFNRIHTTRKEAKGMRQTRKSLFPSFFSEGGIALPLGNALSLPLSFPHLTILKGWCA